MQQFIEQMEARMIILSPTIGMRHLRLVPQVANNDGRGLEDDAKNVLVDIETVLRDPRLHEHGFRGPGLGYRKVAKLTVCSES